MFETIDSANSAATLWERLLKLKIYLLGGGLLGVGSALFIASIWPGREKDLGDILRGLSFNLITAGFVLVTVEFFLKRESDELIRTILEKAIATAPVWNRVPTAETIANAVEQGIAAASSRNVLVPEHPTAEIMQAIDGAQEEILILGISLRNILQEDLRKKLKRKLNQSRVKIRILMIDPDSRFIQWREQMWWNQTKGSISSHYRSEIKINAAELLDIMNSNTGPGSIEVRTYDLMPSCYLIAVDRIYHVSFYMTNKSIGCSPFFLLHDGTHSHGVICLRENFDSIWAHPRTRELKAMEDPTEKRRYVVIAGADKDGVVFVKNAHRKWELPAGFIEADETAEVAAVREFREETGMVLEVRDCIFREDFALVYGIATKTVGTVRAGEITEAKHLTQCPPINELSFSKSEDLLIIDTAFSFYRQSLLPQNLTAPVLDSVAEGV
jgi:NUDIX domain